MKGKGPAENLSSLSFSTAPDSREWPHLMFIKWKAELISLMNQLLVTKYPEEDAKWNKGQKNDCLWPAMTHYLTSKPDSLVLEP